MAHQVMNTPQEPDSYKPGDGTPKQGKKTFACPNCGKWAQMHWENLTSMNPQFAGVLPPQPVQEFDDIGNGVHAAIQWTRAMCQVCKKISIWRDEQMVYPLTGTTPPAHQDMPEQVVALYDEARAVAAVSGRAGAGMARSTLEYLLRTVLPSVGVEVKKGDRLEDLIGLAEVEVSGPLKKRLELVRYAGNKSVHVEDVPDEVMVLVLDEENAAILELLFRTVNDVVDELVRVRKESDEAYALLPPGFLENIERKRQQRQQRS